MIQTPKSSNQEECLQRIKEIDQMFTNISAIPYNFLVGNDRRVYTARGFEFEGEIPSNNGSVVERGLIVAFIGTFYDQQPSREMVQTFKSFMDNSVGSNNVTNDYTLIAQDQLATTNQTTNGLMDALRESGDFRDRVVSCKLRIFCNFGKALELSFW